jgi:hypothetical protein
MNVRIFIVTFIVLILQFNSSAQILPGAKQISLSHSDVALSHDVMSHFTNPAGLAQLNWREFGVYYSPAPFGLSELANGYASYIEPTIYGNFAAGFMTYGFELYKENIISLSYSNKFYKNFFLGLRIDYRSLKIENYGEANKFAFSIGGIAYIINNLRTGFAVDNLTRTSYTDEDDQLPTLLKLGLSYDLDTDVIINIAVHKETNFNPSLNFGLDYQLIKYINLRIGFQTDPSSFSGGIGINYSMFEIDYATFNHQDLGFTHQAGLIIHFSSDKNRMEKIKEYLGFN